MSSISHPELVLLALLADGPVHAYELVQRTRAMEVGRWARVPESTLYAVLGRMEEAGWVEGSAERGEKRRTRTAYRRTAEGEGRLSDLVARALSEPAPVYSDLLVGGVFAAATGATAAIEDALLRVRAHRNMLRDALDGDRLSEPGRVILEFYIGLAGLHIAVLERLADDGDHRPGPPLVPEV